MSDIDIMPTYGDETGYEITTGETGRLTSGNVLLLNRFQIVFFSEGLNLIAEDGSEIVDDFGGRAYSILGIPKALTNTDGIRASISAAVDNTVKSIQSSTSLSTPDTEKLSSADVSSVSFSGDTVMATINVVPLELETTIIPQFQIPVVSR